MSRWLYYISALLLVFLFCSAHGCQEGPEAIAEREMQRTIGLIDSVKLTFTTDTLPLNELKAYEMTAIQKLIDMADYLRVISDTTLDVRLRQQAYEMILGMCLPGRMEDKDWEMVYSERDLNARDPMLSQCRSEGLPCYVQPSQISIIEPFTRKNDTTLKGTLLFCQNNILHDGRTMRGGLTRSYTIDIYLIRNMKTFGSQQLRVWETYLGDIDIMR
jgi:hypothetical protein